MFKHILVPIDGSALSASALDQAFALARETKAKVTILTVIEPFHMVWAGIDEAGLTMGEYEEGARERAAATLAAAEAKAKAAGVDCHVLPVEHAEPYRAILDAAADCGCDLIAMASHGRRGLAALLLGSVTVKVLTHSTLPVLVYR
ncbi:universal stress protein [Zavarzinia sp.]|uniref:universal stress protein n=1 Tax=Zavarzinia sp. TaxID=2027920 RepID=UPI003565F4C7